MAPQIIFIVLTILSVIGSVADHGNDRKHNGFLSVGGLAISWVLLYWGDFFDVLFK